MCVAGEEVEEVASWLQEELESCKRRLPLVHQMMSGYEPSPYLTLAWFAYQVVDARAGPGFKVTKPKKIKNSDGKRKSKLKKLHKFKRQSKQFKKYFHVKCPHFEFWGTV